MLGLFSNKSDHPLANLKSIQQLLNNLPATDGVGMLDEIGHWVEELFDPANEFRLDHQFAALRLLDDAAHPHLIKIIQSYFAAVPPAAFQENRLWNAMSAYYTFCELGYLKLLQGLRNGDKGRTALKSNIPLICARGIYAIFGRMECAAVKYEALDPQLWNHLADFYAYAEAERCLEDEIHIYGGATANTSVGRMFASLVIWYSISVGALRPLDLHIAKYLVLHMRKSFSVSSTIRTGVCRGASRMTQISAWPSASTHQTARRPDHRDAIGSSRSCSRRQRGNRRLRIDHVVWHNG